MLDLNKRCLGGIFDLNAVLKTEVEVLRLGRVILGKTTSECRSEVRRWSGAWPRKSLRKTLLFDEFLEEKVPSDCVL